MFQLPEVLVDAPDSFFKRLLANRFVNDPSWGRCLDAFRLDKAPNELRRLLDSRTTARLRQLSDDQGNNELKKILQTRGFTVIAPDNYTRHTFNLLYTRLAAADPEPVVFQIKASITRKKERNGATVRLPIGERDLFRLAEEPDSITRLPTILEVFVGMEVRVKVNQCVEKGCANGAIGVVHHIDWCPGTTFTETGSRMYRPSREPHTVWIDLPDAPPGPQSPGMPADWPDTVIPLAMQSDDFLYKEGGMTSRERTELKKPESSALCAKMVKNVDTHEQYKDHEKVKIKQFSIVPAFAMTVHGVQGVTKNAIILTDPCPAGSSGSINGSSLYVTLSRLRESAFLWVLHPIPDSVR
ncbi:hypothetical protein H9P43_004141 [Blastocladiella emersonii ATCC 22665]|nr:hypothetical protein H9P43_004141 [Blastocladiella emersonii ATCC 22665]